MNTIRGAAETRIKKILILLVAGIGVNLALAMTKMYIGTVSNSVCILLDGTNNALDVVTCVFTAIGFYIMLSAGRRNIKYGRIEYVAGFVVAAVTVIMGGVFLARSVNRIAMPEPVWFGWESCVIISVAAVVKLGVFLLFYFANKKFKSKALAAVALDSLLDTGVTVASLISFALSARVDYAVDGFFGIVISVLILLFGLRMLWSNLKTLTGAGVGGIEAEVKGVMARYTQLTLIGVDVQDFGYAQTVAIIEAEYPMNMTFSDITALNNRIAMEIEREGLKCLFAVNTKEGALVRDEGGL